MLSKIRDQKPFTNSTKHFWGEMEAEGCYVVYSYTKDWPIAACILNQWYLNTEEASRTASVHLRKVHSTLLTTPITGSLQELQARIANFKRS